MPLPLAADTVTLEDVTMRSAAGEDVANGRDRAHSAPYPISGPSPTTTGRYTRQRALSSPASADATDRDAADDDSEAKAIS